MTGSVMVPDDAQAEAADMETMALAEELRQAVGGFVRRVRGAAGTPRAAASDTLEGLDRQGPMTVAHLARLRQVRHQSMSAVVAQLEADRLVVRTPDPADARGWIVAITEAGRTTLASDRLARTRWIATVLRDRATTRERRAVGTAVAVLRRLAAAPD